MVSTALLLLLYYFASVQAFCTSSITQWNRAATIITSMASKDDAPPEKIPRTGKKGYVSSRGASNLGVPMAYLTDFFQALDDMCDMKTNPQGYIPVCVAENRLVSDLLQTRLATLATAQAGFTSARESFSYNSPIGLSVMREAVAKILQHHFLSPQQQQQATVISPNHIGIGAGAISVLSNLFFALGAPLDAVLIPAPYYAAFDNDVRAFAGCVPVPVICQNAALGPTVEDLEKARKHAKETLGLNVRFLLLTNPHNPLGVVYAPNVLTDAIAWARSHHMETVVDEIYALSVFDDDSTCDFQSILQLFDNHLGDDLHLVWGLSKDFGASGFRVGVLYTQNEVLLEAMGNLFTFAWVSQPMQLILADLLNDKTFVQDFLTTSRQRLKQSYQICTQVLKELQIPHVTASAGMFVYIDLSEFCSTVQEEATFGQLLMKRARMVMTPGTTQHDPLPGRFRICYAYVSVDVLREGMGRLKKVVTIIRQQGGLGDWIEDDSHWQDII
jgi:aspartate/methionine/tyrosine aminotransferase